MAGAAGAVGMAGAWAQAAPEKASMEIRAIDLVSFMAGSLNLTGCGGVSIPCGMRNHLRG